MTTIYSDSSCNIFTGDLAVDQHGNVWFPISYDLSMSLNALSDSIRVVSPTGRIIKSFPLRYNLYNAYGSFYLKNKLYIGLGSLNLDNPNTLLPISFSADSAIVETPIPMPPQSFSSLDLAICDYPNKISLWDNEHFLKPKIFPNPNFGIAYIDFNITLHDVTLTLYNNIGQLVLTKEFESADFTELVFDGPGGIYFLKIKAGNTEVLVHKILKN